MRCQVTSIKTHAFLISKEISYKSFKEICSGEPKKVNLGYNNEAKSLKVENNTLIHNLLPHVYKPMYGQHSQLSRDWEVLSKFFALHNIEPTWLDCNYTWGWYDEEQGAWTGCMGKV